MKARKLVSAAVKLGGAATTGIIGTNYMVLVMTGRHLSGEIHALGISCIGSSLLLGKEALQDVVGAFKRSDEE